MAAASMVEATEPRSAIPWLSQSIQAPQSTPRRPQARPPQAAPEDSVIAVTPLDAISLDAVGLLGPEETGLPRNLWGPTPAPRVQALILSHPDAGVPETRALFRRILLAEADPPPGSGASAEVLVARVDRLLEAGALEAAEALIERAGAETPELFRRMFDIGLLLDRAEPACQALRRNPALSPTLPARIFCLARDGDWNAAEITLTLGSNVGQLSDAEEMALARFLDPELFEHLEAPPPPEPFTPLDFLLREAVGLPRPSGALPPAFLHVDLVDYMPMRQRITAAERLVLEDAVEASVLFEAYRAGKPAASGSFWDRAAAVQALDAALDEGEHASVGEALLEADKVLAERGLRLALAEAYRSELAALDPEALDAAARHVLLELLLLADEHTAAERAAGPAAEPETLFLLAIAGVKEAAELPPGAGTALVQAAYEGLAGEAEDPLAERLVSYHREGRVGEALLEALALLAEGPRVDPASLRAALTALRASGQEAAARRIALQTVLFTPVDL